MSERLVSEVVGRGVTLRWDDPEHAAEHVSVWSDVELGDTTMTAVDGGWELRLDELPVDRLEYLVDVDGAMVTDPSNPGVVPGPFGDHSWLALPGYHSPAWLEVEPVPGERATLTLSRTGAGRIDTELWSPADAAADEVMPLLLSHDGPEMDRYGGLTRYVGALIAEGRLPRLRVGLLSPGPQRNRRYAANARYARALVNRVLPAVRDAVPTRGRPVLIGQSLGALAALHAAWTTPGTFAGLLLQSGSFFTAELDPQESGFEFWPQVSGFVASVHAASLASPSSARVAVTCGTAEENLANNRALAAQLQRIGIPTAWGEVRDGHTWTCWRDTLDPCLTDLLQHAFG